jgi:hypothetical protein
MDSIPFCMLAADDLAKRLAWIRAEILPHALRRERLASGVAWELAAVAGLAEKLDALIALERQCCSGVDFARVPSGAPERLRFEIRGVDPEAEPFRSLGAL